MKFSLELSRTGGDLLKQHVVKPHHAEIFRQGQGRPHGFPGGRKPGKSRMYDAATSTDLNRDFPISITSANAEIMVSIVGTRTRARRLIRDNPYARGIERNYCNNICGDDPFRLEMRLGKKDASGKFIEETETNLMIEEAWREAGRPENCTVMRNMSRLELYHQVQASQKAAGGVLARHWPAYPKNKFGYAIEPIEIDRLDHYWNRPAGGSGNEICFSIEMDQWHAPVAYWILSRHPGDTFAYSNETKYRERIPAEEVIAFFEMRLRPGQYVGMSAYASVIQRLHRLDQYDIAEMQAAIVSAIKIGFFTKTNTADEYVGTETTEDGMKIDEVRPGMNFEEMPDNFDLKQFDPQHPVEAYAAFTDQNLRGVAQGAGQAHSSVSGNYAGMSFSTGRLEKMPERDDFKKEQEHMCSGFVRPYFETWVKYAILSGQIKVPITRLEEIQRAARFHGKRWEYINPLQDVQADILSIEAGLNSRSHIIAESERGGDVETVDAEIASDKAVDETHDLDFSGSDPALPSLKTPPGSELANPNDNSPAVPGKTGTKQTIKKKGYARLERTLRLLHETDEEFAKEGHLKSFLDFKARRNGHLISGEPEE